MFRSLSSGIYFLLVVFVFSQDEENLSRWFLGFEASLFRPSMKQTGFYAGYPQNVNNIDYVLNNPYWYQEIKNLLDENIYRDTFALVEYPSRMRYDLAFLPGVHFQYRWSDEFYLSFFASTARLKVMGMTVFEVYPPLPGEVHSYVYLPVEGIERRNYFSFYFTYLFSPDMPGSWFGEVGALLINTRVLSHRLYVFEKYYNLQDVYGVPYVPNAGLTEMEVYQGGTTAGIGFSLGYRLKMGRQFAFDVLYHADVHSIKLPGYSQVGYHQKLGVRLFMNFVFN